MKFIIYLLFVIFFIGITSCSINNNPPKILRSIKTPHDFDPYDLCKKVLNNDEISVFMKDMDNNLNNKNKFSRGAFLECYLASNKAIHPKYIGGKYDVFNQTTGEYLSSIKQNCIANQFSWKIDLNEKYATPTVRPENYYLIFECLDYTPWDNTINKTLLDYKIEKFPDELLQMKTEVRQENIDNLIVEVGEIFFNRMQKNNIKMSFNKQSQQSEMLNDIFLYYIDTRLGGKKIEAINLNKNLYIHWDNNIY